MTSHSVPESGHDNHDHGHDDRSYRTLALVTLLNVAGFVLELAGGLLFGSVALISDAIHMFFDAFSYLVAFTAAYLASKYDPSDTFTYGLHRLEPIAAFLNGVLLLPMVGYIVYESYTRFLNPTTIDSIPTIWVGVAGLVVNVVSVLVLHGDELSLNERGAFYHLLGDTGSSVVVIGSAATIKWTGITIIDPITAALISVVILWSAGRVLRGSLSIFLHTAPVPLSDIREAVEHLESVDGVVDGHTWEICSDLTMATVHVQVDLDTPEQIDAVTNSIHHELSHLGVDHATVELHNNGTRDEALRNHSH